MNDGRLKITKNREHRGHLYMAYLTAAVSDDNNTRTGAWIVDVDGDVVGMSANELPQGVETLEERFERPLKYTFIQHAERGAIAQAAKYGKKTEGATMYSPFLPCADCAQSIISAGISTVVSHEKYMLAYGGSNWFHWGDENVAKWGSSIDAGIEMMWEAGIDIELYRGDVNGLGKPQIATRIRDMVYVM